jgi:two-component system response regulator FixJ
MKAHIMIVDDEEAMRLSLSSVLATYGFTTSAFADAAEALEASKNVEPDCVLMDVRLPGMDGLTAQRILREATPALPVIMITGHGDVAMAVRAMKNGAFDFVEKPVDDEQLVLSINTAVASRRRSAERGSDARTLGARYGKLTDREKDVATMVAEGYSSAAIAATLEISVRTVDHHRANVLAKMQATSLPQLIRFLLTLQQSQERDWGNDRA